MSTRIINKIYKLELKQHATVSEIYESWVKINRKSINSPRDIPLLKFIERFLKG